MQSRGVRGSSSFLRQTGNATVKINKWMVGLRVCLAGAWAEPLPSDPTMFVEPVLLSSNRVYFSLLGWRKWTQLSVADLQEEVTSRSARRLPAQCLHLHAPVQGSSGDSGGVAISKPNGAWSFSLQGDALQQKPQKAAQLVISPPLPEFRYCLARTFSIPLSPWLQRCYF